MLVVPPDPAFQPADQPEGTAPFLQPEALLFEGAHEALGISVALRVIVAGKHLMAPQGAAGRHEGDRGQLTAVIAHEGQALIPDAVGELAVDCHVQRCQPLFGSAPHACTVAHDRLGVPIEHHADIDPAKARHQDLRHVNAPPLIGLGGFGFPASWRPLDFELQVRCDDEMMLPHQSQDPLLVDRQVLDETQ
jgi:hypothetical protein